MEEENISNPVTHNMCAAGVKAGCVLLYLAATALNTYVEGSFYGDQHGSLSALTCHKKLPTTEFIQINKRGCSCLPTK